jgi:hypothetical protein
LSVLVAAAALAAVWAVNFLLILPSVNPAFTALLPPAATFVSKLLFGVCMALAFEAGCRPRRRSSAQVAFIRAR